MTTRLVAFLFSLLVQVLLITATTNAMTTAPKIKLTYFDIEGRGEPIRLALKLACINFEDERINHEGWKDLKPKTPYGQLPIITIDDTEVRAQSVAILHWIAAEFAPDTLYPKSKVFDIEEALAVVGDMEKSWAPAMYMAMAPTTFGHPEDFGKTDEGKQLVKQLREKFLKDKMPQFLDFITKLLAKHDNKWIASTDAPTIADCVAVPFLRQFTRGHIDYVPTSCLESHPEVVNYVKRFCALPEIQGRYTTGLF